MPDFLVDELIEIWADWPQEPTQHNFGQVTGPGALGHRVLNKPHHGQGGNGNRDVGREPDRFRGGGGLEAPHSILDAQGDFLDDTFPLRLQPRTDIRDRGSHRVIAPARDHPRPVAQPHRIELDHRDGQGVQGTRCRVRVRGEDQVCAGRAWVTAARGPGDGRRGRPLPHAFRKWLHDRGRTVARPHVQRRGRLSRPPVPARAIAEDQHRPAAGWIDQHRGIAARAAGDADQLILDEVESSHVPKSTKLAQGSTKLVDQGPPHPHGGSGVGDDGQVEPPLRLRDQYRKPLAGVSDASGGRLFVDHGEMTKTDAALERPQRPLHRTDVAEHRGRRHQDATGIRPRRRWRRLHPQCTGGQLVPRRTTGPMFLRAKRRARRRLGFPGITGQPRLPVPGAARRDAAREPQALGQARRRGRDAGYGERFPEPVSRHQLAFRHSGTA